MISHTSPSGPVADRPASGVTTVEADVREHRLKPQRPNVGHTPRFGGIPKPAVRSGNTLRQELGRLRKGRCEVVKMGKLPSPVGCRVQAATDQMRVVQLSYCEHLLMTGRCL